ncbi:MAG: 2-oxoglutarate dehydrogenase, E2 component, dihydrolipoamide succinyltransferase [Aridibacter sp.]
MSVEIVMPQMGESITEGTVSKWLKQVGDEIERDETVLEISTDKVDAEVPAPQAGVLLEIRVAEGETVEVDSVVGVIGEEGESPTSSNGNEAKAETDASDNNRGIDEISEHPMKPDEAKVTETAVEATAEATSADIASDDSSDNSATPETPANSATSSSGKATEVEMPQMGESITEGTVSKWLKQVGDSVERDENLLEISTDKVDAEVPSPVAGTLLEIRAEEGETVEVGSVVGLVGTSLSSQQSAVNSQETAQIETKTETPKTETETKTKDQRPKTKDQNIEETEGRSYDYQHPGAVADARKTSSNGHDKSLGEQTVEELRRTRSSPLVRNIAKEHNVDISQISGSGMSGRVTKKDILSFIESGAAVKPQDLLKQQSGESRVESGEARKVETPQVQPVQKAEYKAPQISSQVGDRVEPMSNMRKKIAEHMTFSKQTSAHVTSVYEIDMTNVAKFRNKNKDDFQQRYGTKLTYMPFIFQAVTNSLRQFPVVNSQVSGEQIIYKGDINLGMAVALDCGLIVPVIKKADSLSLAGLAQTANDLADRARTKKLMPDEVSGGTFTITNPGVFGGLYGTPIINQPQVAILCVGTIEKRPKVLTTPEGDDVIAIRQMAYFALTYDHRIVDGADAEKFLSHLKNYLETAEFSL